MKKIALLLVSLVLTSTAHAQDCAALVGSCEYYNCKNEQLGCGESNYLLAFGARYCTAFQNVAPAFTEAYGQPWLAEVSLCLQEELEKRDDLSCENVRQVALEAHVACYVRTDYCSLPVVDKSRVARVVWRELRHRDMRAVWREIRRQCKQPD